MYPAVVGAGLACGFINTLAGSGSLITLPLLIFLGLPANVANGTNRIAILFQNMVAVRGFYAQGLLDLKKSSPLLIPAVSGSLLGAMVAVDLDERMMRLVIACLMVVMLGVILVKPKRWLEGSVTSTSRLLQWLTLFGAGFYGGFIQAGVGIFLLATLVLACGFDLVRGNAVKVLIVLGFAPFALGVFVFNELVRWDIGVIMAIGNMGGAWLGTKLAAKGGAGLVRYVLIVAIAASAIKMFWDLFA